MDNKSNAYLDQLLFKTLVRGKNALLQVFQLKIICSDCSSRIKKEIDRVDVEINKILDRNNGVILKS